jgi:hypothetical protein
VLVDRGFSVEVDGVPGPRTRDALISFQRREGLQATGEIDVRTVTALGVQDRISVSGEQRSTTGSGSSQPDAQPSQSQQRRGQQPSTGSTQQSKQPEQSRQGTTGSGPQSSQQPGQSQQSTTGSGSSGDQQQGSEMQRHPDSNSPQSSGITKSPASSGTPQNRPMQSPSGSSK